MTTNSGVNESIYTVYVYILLPKKSLLCVKLFFHDLLPHTHKIKVIMFKNPPSAAHLLIIIVKAVVTNNIKQNTLAHTHAFFCFLIDFCAHAFNSSMFSYLLFHFNTSVIFGLTSVGLKPQ